MSEYQYSGEWVPALREDDEPAASATSGPDREAVMATNALDPRPDHWFSTRSRSLNHRKAAEGDFAACSKRIKPRSAPHNETCEWGIWYQTDEWLAQWKYAEKCPACEQIAKEEEAS